MTMEETITSDLSQFGGREIEEQRQILKAYYNGNVSQMFKDYFYDEKVEVVFNKMSGYVFLTDSEFNSAMNVSQDDQEPFLELHLNCSECGYEGTETEIAEDENYRCEHILEQYPDLKENGSFVEAKK